MEISNSYSNRLSCGINSWATPLPSGWEHLAILAIGSGINHTCDVWGQGLRGLYGKPLPNNQAEIPLKMIGVWTDNTGYYYYTVDAPYASYEEEMIAVKKYWETTCNIKQGYLMLDSWWYKKGCDQNWNQNKVGIYKYEASPEVFPSGLNGFHTKLGLPLFTHHRYYLKDACSPFYTQYKSVFSGGLPTSYNAWKDIVYHVADSGVITFEQDWLNSDAKVANHLGDLDSAMGNMAKACAEKKMTQQYCMVTPMYYGQAASHRFLLGFLWSFHSKTA